MEDVVTVLGASYKTNAILCKPPHDRNCDEIAAGLESLEDISKISDYIKQVENIALKRILTKAQDKREAIEAAVRGALQPLVRRYLTCSGKEPASVDGTKCLDFAYFDVFAERETKFVRLACPRLIYVVVEALVKTTASELTVTLIKGEPFDNLPLRFRLAQVAALTDRRINAKPSENFERRASVKREYVARDDGGEVVGVGMNPIDLRTSNDPLNETKDFVLGATRKHIFTDGKKQYVAYVDLSHRKDAARPAVQLPTLVFAPGTGKYTPTLREVTEAMTNETAEAAETAGENSLDNLAPYRGPNETGESVAEFHIRQWKVAQEFANMKLRVMNYKKNHRKMSEQRNSIIHLPSCMKPHLRLYENWADWQKGEDINRRKAICTTFGRLDKTLAQFRPSEMQRNVEAVEFQTAENAEAEFYALCKIYIKFVVQVCVGLGVGNELELELKEFQKKIGKKCPRPSVFISAKTNLLP